MLKYCPLKSTLFQNQYFSLFSSVSLLKTKLVPQNRKIGNFGRSGFCCLKISEQEKDDFFYSFLQSKKCVNLICDKLNFDQLLQSNMPLIQLIMPKYLDTITNMYTDVQVSRKLGNSLENLEGFGGCIKAHKVFLSLSYGRVFILLLLCIKNNSLHWRHLIFQCVWIVPLIQKNP